MAYQMRSNFKMFREWEPEIRADLDALEGMLG